MAYKLIWSPASRDDLRDIVTFISRTAVGAHKPLAIASSQRLTSCKPFPRLVESFLSIVTNNP